MVQKYEIHFTDGKKEIIEGVLVGESRIINVF